MEYIVFLSLVMLTGIAQGRMLSPNEIMRNIRWNEVNDGLYQGDMVLTDEQKRALVERQAIKDESYRWPKSDDGTVNIDYRFGDTVVNRSVVALAISRWQEATCIKFNKVTAPVAKPHLIFVTHPSECFTNVGQIYELEGQDVNLAPDCFKGGEGNVIHELGHSLGLYHEQSRSDRDDYLYVMPSNVKAGMENNFYKEDTNNYGLPYDYSSIMQYDETAFSKNDLYTMVAKDPLAQPFLAEMAKKSLSFMDKKIVNLMYNCIDTWLTKCSLTATPCQNQGYTKSDCSCECPAGTSGANCQTRNEPYIDALINAKRGQRITTEGKITSPDYPEPVMITLTSHVQSIVAPTCHKVKLTFIDFDMPGLTETTVNGVDVKQCWSMILEIRLDDPPITGTKYCGANIKATQTFESVGRSMVLLFSTEGDILNQHTGYSATVQFVPVTTGNCSRPSSSEGATPPAVKQP